MTTCSADQIDNLLAQFSTGQISKNYWCTAHDTCSIGDSSKSKIAVVGVVSSTSNSRSRSSSSSSSGSGSSGTSSSRSSSGSSTSSSSSSSRSLFPVDKKYMNKYVL